MRAALLDCHYWYYLQLAGGSNYLNGNELEVELGLQVRQQMNIIIFL